MFDDEGEARPRLASLTSLRWFAASLVFLSHAQGHLFYSRPWLTFGWFSRIATPGMTGVSFFFILSGFVLMWSYRPGTTASTFYRRRLARIYPAYAVVAVLSVPIIVAMGEVHGVTHLVEAFLPLTLLQAWVPHYRIVFSGNGVSWSLSCEAFFYAMFPVLVGGIARMSHRARVTVLALAMFVPVGLAVVLRTTDILSARYLIMYTNPATRFVEFVVGVILATLLRAGVRVPWLRVGPALAVAAGAYVLAGWVPASFQAVAVTVLPFSALIFAAAQADLAGRTPRLLAHPVLMALGEWSFAFYLVHQMILRLLQRIDTTSAWQAGALTVAAYLVGVVLSRLLFAFVERPLERRLRTPRRREAKIAEAAA